LTAQRLTEFDDVVLLLDGSDASNEDNTKNGAQCSSENGSFLLGKELSKPLKGGGLRIKETRSKRHLAKAPS
jgi:hypothetical protein